MTTVTEKRVRCCLCEVESKFTGIGSAQSAGFPDLDTRPPEMVRSTMFAWIQRCPECGYCARDVAEPRPEAVDIVNTKEYKRQLNDQTYPKLANSFLCRALIDFACGDYSAATWALTQAAWVCDDSGASDQALVCRQQAANMLRVAKERGQQVSEPEGSSTALLVDLLRRSGRLDDARKAIAAKRDMIADGNILRVLDFQTALIDKNDMLCHTLAEVFAEEKRSEGDRMPPPEDYQRPSLTVDVVVVAPIDGQHKVLLVQRKHSPFEGCWAIPGGFVDPHEPLEDAARRELREETGTEPARLEQLHTFGAPGRDPRGWTISVAYLAVLEVRVAQSVQPHAGDDAAEVGWFDLLAPPPLAFDHADILAHARKALAIGD